MNKKYLYASAFAIVLILSSFHFYTTENTAIEKIEKLKTKLLYFQTSEKYQKIYIHTDKNNYISGDTLWFKAYIIDRYSNKPYKLLSFLQVNLTNEDGLVVKKDLIKFNPEKSFGHLLLDETVKAGSYYLTIFPNGENNSAYNLFSKHILVNNNKEDKLIANLKFDKKAYQFNDSIQAEFSLITGKGAKAIKTKFDYMVYNETQTVFQDKGITNKQGKANVSFSIPQDKSANPYLIKFTIKTGKSSFDQKFSIPLKSTKLLIDFYPEGGNLVYSVNNKMGVECTDNYGNPIIISGLIKDQEDNTITSVTTFRDGLGYFCYKPEPNSNYSFHSNYNEDTLIVNLPKPIANSFVLHQIESDNINTNFKVYSTKQGVQNIYLNTYSAGKINWESHFEVADSLEFSIPLSNFSPGIASITLFDENIIPIAERLFFPDPNNILKVQVIANKKEFQPKEKVILAIKTTDSNNKPISANLSISVSTDTESNNNHIVSSLLLNSDLDIKQYDMDFYLKDDSASKSALDNLLLIKGWRGFSWKGLQNNDSIKVNYSQKFGISGKVVSPNGKIQKNAKVRIMNTKSWLLFETKTNGLGQFAFSLGEYSSVANGQFVINAESARGDKNVQVILYEKDFPVKSINPVQLTDFLDKKEGEEFFNYNFTDQNTSIRQKGDNTNITYGSHLIDEVTIKGSFNVWQPEYEDYTKVYNSSVKSGEDLHGAVTSSTGAGFIDILRLVDGNFRVEGINGGHIILFRGNNSITAGNNSGALIVLDGVPMGEDIHQLDNLNIEDIKEIKVTKSAAASHRFAGGYLGGLIEVTTISPQDILLKIKNRDMNLATVKGFQLEKTFYSPKYETEESLQIPDPRTTIYFNPLLQTNSNGTARVQFYNSDIRSKINCTIEGMSPDGLPGFYTLEYVVN